MKWEYTVVHADHYGYEREVVAAGRKHKVSGWVAVWTDSAPTVGLRAICNEQGDQGWELVSTEVIGNTYQVEKQSGVPFPSPCQIALFFKRPKPE